MDQASMNRLRRCAALHGAGRLAKLARAPLRMGYSLACEKWLRASGGVRPVTARTFWGDRMSLFFPEEGSMALYRYRFIEEGLTSIFISQIKPGMTVFDIGAHFGYFTLLALHLTGPSGEVHAFEPTPSTFKVLESNVSSRPNVRLNNIALYSRVDELTFHDFGLAFSQFNSLTAGRMTGDARTSVQARACKVKTQPLDDYVAACGARPNFVKIDAENAEYEILQGMSRTLSEIKPMITLEVGDIDPAHASSKPIQLLLDRGYRAFEYDAASSAMRPHQPRANYRFDNLLFVAT